MVSEARERRDHYKQHLKIIGDWYLFENKFFGCAVFS